MADNISPEQPSAWSWLQTNYEAKGGDEGFKKAQAESEARVAAAEAERLAALPLPPFTRELPPLPPAPVFDRPYQQTLDHGLITVDPNEKRFAAGLGETGQWVDPLQSSRPYSVTVDHGQITVDPNASRVETVDHGQITVDPTIPPSGYPGPA